MRVLLDTDAYSALMRGHDEVVHRVREAERLLLSAIVAGELLFGFRAGPRYDRNRKDLEAFLQNPYVEFVPVTLVTAERFGRISAALRTKGKPIPTNDIWIAAHAQETGSDLLSFDRHYQDIDGIVWLNPSAE